MGLIRLCRKSFDHGSHIYEPISPGQFCLRGLEAVHNHSYSYGLVNNHPGPASSPGPEGSS